MNFIELRHRKTHQCVRVYEVPNGIKPQNFSASQAEEVWTNPGSVVSKEQALRAHRLILCKFLLTLKNQNVGRPNPPEDPSIKDKSRTKQKRRLVCGESGTLIFRPELTVYSIMSSRCLIFMK